MSVLQTLRDRAGVLLAVVIGVSLIFFVLGDFLGNGAGGARKQKEYFEIGQIDGNSISYQEYDQRLQNLVEVYKMSGTSNITEAMSESMREDIWNKIIMEEVMGEEFTELGLGVSSDEVESMVLGDIPHPIVQQLFANRETGVLDKSFLVNFLKNTEFDPQAKAYWMFFEDEIVNDKLNAKFNNLISKGLYVTNRQAEFEANITSQSVDFSFVMKLYSTIADSSVIVSNGDLQKYYDEHKDNYTQESRRSMEYVEFEVIASAEDVKNTDEDIKDLIEDFSKEERPVQFINLSADSRHFEVFRRLEDIPEMVRDFASAANMEEVYGPYVEDETYKIARLLDIEDRPDSVHVRHILISANQYRPIEDARNTADSLLNLIETGTSFETLAILSSDDQGSAQLGGDLGWFEEGNMITEFNNACFENKKGDLKIVETSFGYHIVEILDQSRKSTKYHIGIIDRAIEPSSITYQNIYSVASRFAGSNDTYEKFNQAVADEGLSKKVSTDVNPNEKLLPGLESPRLLVMALFESEENSIILDRNEQAVFELGDKFVVAYCNDIKEEGHASLVDVESDIRYAVLNEKKAEKIIADISEQTKELTSIDEIASVLNLTVQEATNINFNSFSIPAAGIEPSVIASASSAEEGFLSQPIKGNNGIFILAVNTVNKDQAAQDTEIIRSRLSSTFEVRANYEAFEAIRKASNIIDKRYKFY